MHTHDARAQTGLAGGIGHDHCVILFVDPCFRREVGVADQRAQPVHGVDADNVLQGCGGRCLFPGAIVFGCGAGQFGQRQIGLHLAVQHDDETVFWNGLAHDGEIEVPFVEDRLRLGFLFGAKDHEHAFLALGQHHLIGGHAAFAHRNRFEVEPDAQATLVAHFHRRTGKPRRTHILDRDDGAGCHELQRRLHQALFGEGVADLNGGALFLDRVVEFGRRHGRPADAVAPGLRPKVDDRHPYARGGGIENLVRIRETGGESVDETVAVIGGIKAHLAPHGRHAEAVAVAAHAGDDPVDQLARLGVIGPPEAERVHRRDGPRAHGKDIPQDATHTRGRPLIGFDVGRVVVALHLEDQRLPVADVHDARVLPRPADDLRPVGGQGAQPFLRGFIGAMLVPHGRKDTEFSVVRIPSEDLLDFGIFVGGEPVRGDQVFRDGRFVHSGPPTSVAGLLEDAAGAGKGHPRRSA